MKDKHFITAYRTGFSKFKSIEDKIKLKPIEIGNRIHIIVIGLT